MQKVEDMGGMVKAVREGHIQREVSHQAYSREKKIQSGEIPKIGVNKYVMAEEGAEIEMHPFNPNVADEQKKKLERLRRERDNAGVEKALIELKEAARTGENVMSHMLEAVKSYATLGEVTKVLKEVFGEFKEPVGL
jgi:methylmalonyl-CoA mutase N-terminal domain/subunit